MIRLRVAREGRHWYGIAHEEGLLVATVAAGGRDAAARMLRSCLPAGLRAAGADEIDVAPEVDEGSEFERETLRMLDRLESGNEEGKRFALSPARVPQPLRAVLETAAAIPIGYVATYGDIAAVAGTEARVVGHAMASNPLYPIVPCHRVVGAGYALVGYTGSQGRGALRAKLARLRAEARGHRDPVVLEGKGGLRLAPVEWAIARAVRDGVEDGEQIDLL